MFFCSYILYSLAQSPEMVCYYSAQCLGTPIFVEKRNQVFGEDNKNFGNIQLQSLQLSEIEKFPPWIKINVKESKRESVDIESISGSIEIFSMQSKWELNSQNLKTTLIFSAENGNKNKIGLKITNRFHIQSNELDFMYEPLIRFRQSFDLGNNNLLSFGLTENNLFTKMKFNFPGMGNDELEVNFKNNLPEIIINNREVASKTKSIISLRYALVLESNIKLEISKSYNLLTNNRKTSIKLNI